MVENFRRRIMTGAISVVAGIAVLGSFLYFLSGKMEEEAAIVAADREIIRNNSQLIQGLAGIKANASEVEKYTKAFGALLPGKDELVNVSGWLDGLSRAHQVSAGFSFQGDVVESNESAAGYIGFSLDATGAYDNLVSFLKDIESKAPRYLIALDNFDLKRGGDRYRISARGKIFFR